ncbi:hypothetical protein M3Y94_01132400 [Aphelenchoides besseyi]|nr:hypothetical protein M3Y94_01132400 [Aphelenchoides besseyi]
MEIGKRYVEQLQTTVETMRRRCVAVYDVGIKAGQRSMKLAERAREIAEPAAYDLRDHVLQACNEQGALDANDRETRNSLIELYLGNPRISESNELCFTGIAVLMVGFSSGQLSGISFIGQLLGRIFNPWIEIAMVVLLPVYVMLSFRKLTGLDDTERRVWLFGLAMFEGALVGHLVGDRMIRVVPAVFFLQPLVFALLTDYELSPASVYSDRQRLLGTAMALSGGVSLIFASIPSGGISFGVILMALAQSGILFVHFQLVIAAIKNKTYGASEAQLLYVVGILVAQLIVAIPFGGSSVAESSSS